ncbi:MAG: family 43 glycosylhydrolase [Bacteroidales bacterium]
MIAYFRYFVAFIILLHGSIIVCSQSVSFLTYKNPIIPGDHPDCTVTKIGNNYYTTGSSFNLEPQLYHSTDLVHWRVISKPVSATWEGFGDAPGGGCWGGQMVYHHNKYWHYFSRANTMYFTTADSPEGPWSVPVRVNNPPQLPYSLGYDNSIFIDDDGKWYLVVKNGQPNNGIVELGSDGQPTGVVYNLSWLNPVPELPYSWAEGPVMWKYKGYYYYSFARDLSGGQKVMRSKTLTADASAWEMLGDFFNENDPLKPTSLFTSPNHSSAVVMASDSTFWVVHPLYAKGEWRGQGRQGLLNQVFYDANGKPTAMYPINSHFTAPRLPSSGIPWMVPKSDFFESGNLNPEWQFYGYTPANLFSLTERPGWLRLSPKTRRFNLLSKNDGEHNYSLITRVDFEPQSPQDEAGLVIMRGDEKMFVKLVSTVNALGRRIIRFSFNDDYYQADNLAGSILWLKLVRVNHIIMAYYSKDGTSWTPFERTFDISAIDSYSDFSTFTGTRQGLYVQNRSAFFDLYIYRDAYTPILAECPANEFGTWRTISSDGSYVLDSIHYNDWALFAGVEFGTGTYAFACDSVEFVASSVTGGVIEVWLDSIDSGDKVAACNVTSTGGWNEFRVFKAKTKRITGRHDVYLRFLGVQANRLMQLKWFRFIPIHAPRVTSAASSADGKSIEVVVTNPIVASDSLRGFTVYVNGIAENIDSVRVNKENPSLLRIYLQNPLAIDDTLALSYTAGNVLSVDSLPLQDFNNLWVDHRMVGARPLIKTIQSNLNGDSIKITFSKKIQITEEQCSRFILRKNLTVTQNPSGCRCGVDSLSYTLGFSERFYYEDTLDLSYPLNDITAVNGSVLNAFLDAPVQNIARGYPLQLRNAEVLKKGTGFSIIHLKFDKPILKVNYPASAFSIFVNGKHATVSSLVVAHDTVKITFSPAAKIGDTIYLSYENGNLQSVYYGKLENFYNLLLTVPTGTHSVADYPIVEVYPNPSDGHINVAADELFNLVRITSLQGTEVFRKRINPTRFLQLALSLSPGVYMMEIEGNKIRYRQKIVIK